LPQLSVIIPVYNNSSGLRKVLWSLVNQDFDKILYEIIVSDNGSTDKTLDVAKEYADEYPQLVRYVIEDKIQSSYAARNKGIQIAQGDILAFTDSDCVPCESWLTEGCKALRKDNASMIAGRIEFTFKESQPNIWEYFDAAGKLNQKSYVEGAGFGATANLFVRKEMFKEYGMFLSELESGGDYEFGRRLTQVGEPLKYSEEALVFHPARPGFRSKLAKSKRIAKGQKNLARMGLLDHGQLNWRQLLLTLYYPTLPEVRMRMYKKILLVLINNSFRYYNFFVRLQL
jgi:glycosyltransferase involved in cell wall biosynthesis